jgi:hypothetical protein
MVLVRDTASYFTGFGRFLWAHQSQEAGWVDPKVDWRDGPPRFGCPLLAMPWTLILIGILPCQRPDHLVEAGWIEEIYGFIGVQVPPRCVLISTEYSLVQNSHLVGPSTEYHNHVGSTTGTKHVSEFVGIPEKLL